ncbi:hypothetical protein JCM10450v2_000776 [Rhodotorula kratochvilovae]
MAKTYHKATDSSPAVYKPDSQSVDEWIVVVGDVAAADKWKGGDRYVSPTSTVPLVDIVDSFDIFHTGQGSQGLLRRPSKQELETVFETSNEDAIIEIILTKGTIKSADTPHQWTSKNDSKSGSYQTSVGGASGNSARGGR